MNGMKVEIALQKFGNGNRTLTEALVILVLTSFLRSFHSTNVW
jgi:hypothetical protein